MQAWSAARDALVHMCRGGWSVWSGRLQPSQPAASRLVARNREGGWAQRGLPSSRPCLGSDGAPWCFLVFCCPPVAHRPQPTETKSARRHGPPTYVLYRKRHERTLLWLANLLQQGMLPCFQCQRMLTTFATWPAAEGVLRRAIQGHMCPQPASIPPKVSCMQRPHTAHGGGRAPRGPPARACLADAAVQGVRGGVRAIWPASAALIGALVVRACRRWWFRRRSPSQLPREPP